jgi:AcrR family transcriptional regulator
MNDENVLDRRVRRTRRQLAQALINLTSERAYNAIQVREITDRADIGYATFYRHYDSKDDLMLVVFNQITAELEATAAEPGKDYFIHEGRLIFEHVQKYDGLYRSILHSPEFVGKLKQLLTLRVADQIQMHARDLDELAFPVELAANHMVAALIGMIEWWLEKGKPLPVEEMARIYERLIIQATWAALPARNRLSLPWHG